MLSITQDFVVRRRLAVAVPAALLSVVALLAFAAAPASAAAGGHFTCRGSALRVSALGMLTVEPAVANSANDPCATDSAQTLGFSSGLVNTADVRARTATPSSAFGQVANVNLLPLGLLLHADAATANASFPGSGCVNLAPAASQTSSSVLNLRVGGTAVTVSGTPVTGSQTVAVNLPILIGGVATVTLNTDFPNGSSVTRRAVDITIAGGVDNGVHIVLGEASVGFNGNPCQSGPAGPPVDIDPPVIIGDPEAGHVLTCLPGLWTGNPTRFSYSWSRAGTRIVGANMSTYRVQDIDEGLTLTCTVTAFNAEGAGHPATSAGVHVVLPFVKGCPRATGRLSGKTLGLLVLGKTRAQTRRAFTKSNNRGRRWVDFFCLTPRGVRAGYASNALLSTLSPSEQNRVRGRAVWASTAYAFYAIRGIRPGATVAAAHKVLHTGRPFHVGKNYWYLGQNGSSTAMLKVRHGIVEEIGIADLRLTQKSRSAQSIFVRSFS